MARTIKLHCTQVTEYDDGHTVSFQIVVADDNAEGPEIAGGGSFTLSARGAQRGHMTNADGTQKFDAGLDYPVSLFPDIAANLPA